MKITITPKAVEDFKDLATPTTVSISKISICFNPRARKVLELTKDKNFILEFEDGLLYFKEVPKDTKDSFKITTETAKMSTVQVPEIGKYIDQFLKKGLETKRFSIGELKFEKRLLTLIDSSN